MSADEQPCDPLAAGEDDDPARMLEGGVIAGSLPTGVDMAYALK